MAQEVTNFARFYTSFNQLPCSGEREDLKSDIVRQYTRNRTGSLREMTRTEYALCCEALERLSGRREEQKKKRSQCLKLMQKLGIDTSDWTRINYFCQDHRIAGKPFAQLNNDELSALQLKLRTIQHKGGLRQRKESKPTNSITYVFQMGDNAPKC